MKKNKCNSRDLGVEIDLLDDMLTSLVALRVEKGIITQIEWEDKIRPRIEGKPSGTIRNLES